MTTKSAIFIFLLTLSSASLSAQSAEKSMVKSFNTEGAEKIVLDLPGAVDLKIWDDATVRIEIKVSLPNGNAGMLDELAKVGRYNLVSTTNTGALLITSPNTAKQIKVKGQELKEAISYIVFVPKDFPVQIKSHDTAVAVGK